MISEWQYDHQQVSKSFSEVKIWQDEKLKTL